MLTCPMVAILRQWKIFLRISEMEVAAKTASIKTTRTLATWGVFTREPNVPSQNHNSFLQGDGVVYNSPRNLCALYLKPSFSEVFIFKLQRSFFSPLTLISGSNCSTEAFQFPLPGTPLKQPSFRTRSKASLILHRDLEALPAFPVVQKTRSCFATWSIFTMFINAVTPLRTGVNCQPFSDNYSRDAKAPNYPQKKTLYVQPHNSPYNTAEC